MIDTGLLASTDTAIHLSQQTGVDQLEQHEPGLRIERLLLCGVFLLLVEFLGLS